MKFLLLALLFLITSPSFVSGEMLKCTAKDWALVSRTAHSTHVPILVLFTADACGYCEKLKQDVLKPMFQRDDKNGLAVVREVDINAGGKMIDFNGEKIRSRQFKDRYHVFATPTLLILDEDGRLLTDPIVGYSSDEEYRTLLESHLGNI